jgi:anti-anti-sigma factor
MESLVLARKSLGDFVVYSLDGAFVVSKLVELKKWLNEDFAKKRFYIALDMNRVTHVDSSALGVINNIKKTVDSQGGHFVLYSVPSQVSDSLNAIGILGNLAIVKNEAEFKENFIL